MTLSAKSSLILGDNKATFLLRASEMVENGGSNTQTSGHVQ